MTAYLIKMIACSAVFLLVYRLLLERQKMHRFNRWYLLLSAAASFIIPCTSFTVPGNHRLAALSDDGFLLQLEATTQAVTQDTIADQSIINPAYLLFALYALVAVVLLVRFCRNILQLLTVQRAYETTWYEGVKLVLLGVHHSSFSFLNTVFISRQDYESAGRNAILTHELSHVRQRHSFDILFIEILIALCWFNPVFYLYKRSIRLNHEFLADDAVIHHCADIPAYQHLLLDRISLISSLSLSTPFNYSVTKKRLLMMTHHTSTVVRLVLKGGTVCLLAVALLLFSHKNILAQTQSAPPPENKPSTTVQQQNTTPIVFGRPAPFTTEGVSQETMEEYNTIVQKYMTKNEKGQDVLGKPSATDRNRLQSIYVKMNKQQQASVHAVFFRRIGPMKKEVPTAAQLERWKNPDLYGIWIDEKKVPNEALEKYSASDFSHYYASKLYPKAKKGKRYDVQLDLMTNAFYDNYRSQTLAKPEYELVYRKATNKQHYMYVD